MNAKKWIKVWVAIIMILPVIGGLNYLIDPYGYFSTNSKYSIFLTRVNKPNVLNTKLYTNGQIYIIGTSRQMRVNPNLINSYTNKEIRNIHISGSTLSENVMIASKVKSLGKNFIYGFDAFSLNKYRIDNFLDITNRYETYRNELKKDNKYNVLIQSLLNVDIIEASITHLFYKVFKRDLYFNDTIEDTKIYDLNKTKVINSFNNSINLNDNKIKKSVYTHYSIYPDSLIVKLGNIADKNDIFVIYPKFIFYYKLFQKYQNIEDKYLHAIEVLVNNTKAKVWIFYGKNNITTNFSNFDTDGWHFHPKVAKVIFDDVYGKNPLPKNGFLLTKENVHSYLLYLHKQIQNYDFNKNQLK